ncbi:Ig-like domain-containing protein, partial [Nanoarchaeota archaeon]
MKQIEMIQRKTKNKVLAVICLVIALAIAKIVLAATFDFDPVPPLTHQLNEDEFWRYDVNVTANESLVNFSMEDTPYAGLEIDPNNGTITFTPTNDDVSLSEYYLIIVKNMSDPVLDYITTNTRFNISNVNDLPNITGWTPSEVNVSTYENVSGGVPFEVNITDIDLKHGDILNISWFLDEVPKKNETNITSNDSIISIRSNWTYFPGYADSGMHNVTVRVTDAANTIDYFEWVVDVNNSNRNPVFNKSIPNATWPEGQDRIDNISLQTHYYDLDEIEGTNNLTFGYVIHSIINPWNASSSIIIDINQTTGNVSFFTPQPDWFGAELVQFFANDSFNITYANNITLNITNINDPPVIQCPGDQLLAIEVLYTEQVNGSDIDSSQVYFSDNSSVFNISVNGLISFTPNSTDEGIHDVNISLNDSKLWDHCIVEFNIIDNEKPFLFNISNQTAWEGSLFELNVTANDTDSEDNLTFSDNTAMFEITTINQSPENATGFISFVPVNDDVGNNTIIITVTDSKGASSSKSFNLEVNNINNPPYFNTIPAQDVRVNFTHILDMNSYTVDLDNDLLNFTSNSSLFNITLRGIINATLNSSSVGVHLVNITVGDGAPGGINSTIVTYIVTINQDPIINSTFDKLGREDIQFTLNLDAFLFFACADVCCTFIII